MGQGYNRLMRSLTTKDVARHLGITVRRVQKLCQEGRLGRRVKRTVYRYQITEADLNRFERLRPWGRS